jgi:FkbM family methyltransferase
MTANNVPVILVSDAISDADNQIIPFFLSKHLVWSSTHRKIAERLEKAEEIKVKTITLKSLIEQYGCPDYCKIDIEGNDVIAVHSLMGLDTKPKVISVEAECLGVGEQSTINMIDELYNVGYR